MKDAQYYHVISENLIDGEIRQASENEFARVWLAAGSAEFWKFGQILQAAVNGKRDPVRSRWPAVFFDVIADVSEITNGRFRPTKAH
jgi:hypothetical protein